MVAPAADVADIRYQAPAACPDESSFRARLEARETARATEPAGGRATPEVRVVIVERDGRYHGEVRFTGAATEAVRELDAPDCEALVDAIAFLVALPANLAGDAPSPPAPVTPAPAPAPTPAPTRPDLATGRSSGGARWTLSLGAGAATSSLVAPSLVVGPTVFVEVARARDALLSPALRLSGTRLEGSAVSGAGGGQATFSQWTGELSGCPILVRPWPTISASPCAGLRLGEIRGAASGIVDARSDAELSAAVDALARLRWSPRGFAGLLEAGVGAELPFTRFAYRFLPDAPLFRTAAVGWVAGLQLGAHFP